MRMLGVHPHEADIARLGKVATVYLTSAGPRYTVLLRDGRLIDSGGSGFVVEK